METPGPVFDRPLSECTPDEILTECLTQCGLDKSNVLGWRIDHELKHLDEAEYERWRASCLLILSRRLRAGSAW